MSQTNPTPRGDLVLNQRWLMTAAICINEKLYRRAKELFIGRDLTDSLYPVETFVMESVDAHFTQFGEMPHLDVLRSRMAADLEESEDVAPEDTQEISQIFSMAMSLNEQPPATIERVVHSLMDRFLEECLRRQISAQLSDRRSGSLMDVLQTNQKRLQTGLASGTGRFESVFEKHRKANTGDGRFIELGIPFLDYMIAGTGPASGDVVGHAAPRGGGKTTLSSQVAVSVAKREAVIAEELGTRPKMVYIFNYEEVRDPMTQMLVNLTKTPRDTIDEYIVTGDSSILSSGRNYKTYEQERYQKTLAAISRGAKMAWPLAELERIEAAEKFISKYIQIADFTGDDPDNAELSGRFVEGIRDYITMHQQEIGNPGVAAVIIDYAGSCVRVHISATPGLSDRNQRPLTDDLPLMAKRLIANPMRCFVWIAQQLAAVEASRRPGTRPDPNAFKDCKSFAENCVFTIASGVPTNEGYTIFVQSKARRGGQRGDRVVRLNGKYSRWIDADRDFAIVRGEIMNRKDANRMQAQNVSGTIPDSFED